MGCDCIHGSANCLGQHRRRRPRRLPRQGRARVQPEPRGVHFRDGRPPREEAGRCAVQPVLQAVARDPVHVAEFIVAALDGTTKWPAGSAVVIDNDMTIHAKHFWDKRKTPGPIETLGWPGADELKKVAMDIKGDPYKFKDELCP